jgi:hypothetical protein
VENVFEVIDVLAHEYGWTKEYIENLDVPEISALLEIILQRKQNEARLQSIIIGSAMAGKELNFKKKEVEKTEVDQLKELMAKLKQSEKK